MAAPVVGTAAACLAACTWVMIPVRPWARVSWISRAMRWRSSSVPASRAWASSRAWSSAFSAIAASSLALASVSTMIRLRCSFWEVVISLSG